MTAFPSIRHDYYSNYKGLSLPEKFAAGLAIEPPTYVHPDDRDLNQGHAKIFYFSRLYVTALFYSEGFKSTMGLYGTYALRAYSHFYKSRKVEEIYSRNDRQKFGPDNLKRKHQIEAAKTVAILGASILFPKIAYPLYVANGIVNDAKFLVTAIRAKDKQAILEKIASIAIRVFTLYTIFSPDPIARIALLSFKILEAAYYINKSVSRQGELVHRLGPVAPHIVALSFQIPSLLQAVRAVI